MNHAADIFDLTAPSAGPVCHASGHFGEWMQGRLGPAGPVVLVTLACAALGVAARRMGGGAFALRQNAPAVLSTAQARGMLERLDLPAAGRFALVASAPPGGGAGASTAALVALARAAADGAPLTPEALAAACIAIEGASDPLMLPRPDAALWASRRGRAVETLPPPPAAEIVGGFWGAGQRTDAADLRFPDIADLAAPWRRACAAGDGAGAARIATLSAARTDAMRGPAGDPTPALAARFGALGRVRAHTGSARGLVFAPGAVPDGVEGALRAAGLTGVIRFATGAGA